ncbi:hypothetical protein N7535_000896 [Penicillium sp. DV-2018c]|nr:hypothetical protein N7535_000896 [Penicillium sp. DV-2018c]
MEPDQINERMVETRTGSATAPAPKLSKATKAARAKATKQAKQAIRAAQKAAKEAEKVAKAEAKAAKLAARAAAKTAKAEAKAAKAAKTNKRPAKRAKVPRTQSSTATAHTMQIPTEAQAPGASGEAESDSESDEEREPPTKRQKTGSHDAPGSIDQRHRSSPPAPIPKPQVQIGEWDYSKPLPVPKRIKEGVKIELPQVYIGGSAPWPRWVVTRRETIPEPGLSPAARNLDTGVQWTFDEGHFKHWGGLDYRVLFELAWECFESMMADSALRSEIYYSLAKGPLSAAAASGQKWHPARPEPPSTTHFALGTMDRLELRSDNMAYYFDDYERPPVGIRPVGGIALPFKHVISNKLYNQTRGRWPTAPRSPIPGLENQSDSESDSRDGDENTRHSDEHNQNDQGDGEGSGESSEEGSDSDRPEEPSIGVRQSPESRSSGRQQEPGVPLPLENDEAFAQADKCPVIGSDVGDDSGNVSRLGHNSAHDIAEQIPDDLPVSFGSDNEVSNVLGPACLKPLTMAAPNEEPTAAPSKGLTALGKLKDMLAMAGNRFVNPRGVTDKDERTQPEAPPNLKTQLEVAAEGTLPDSKTINLECQEMRKAPPSPPKDDAAENRAKFCQLLAQAAQAQRAAMRAAAAERISDANLSKPKDTPVASSPIPQEPHNLQDEFLESTKAIVGDLMMRQKHFPDPLAVRRIRVWAGEDLDTHQVKPMVDAALPPWAGVHRPFRSWQDTVSVPKS